MSKARFELRIKRAKLERLRNICRHQNVTCSQLIRDKIDELINNGYDIETLDKVKRIVRELREPFAYIKTPQGRTYAKKERMIRQAIADKIEKIFNL